MEWQQCDTLLYKEPPSWFSLASTLLDPISLSRSNTYRVGDNQEASVLYDVYRPLVCNENFSLWVNVMWNRVLSVSNWRAVEKYVQNKTINQRIVISSVLELAKIVVNRSSLDLHVVLLTSAWMYACCSRSYLRLVTEKRYVSLGRMGTLKSGQGTFDQWRIPESATAPWSPYIQTVIRRHHLCLLWYWSRKQ